MERTDITTFETADEAAMHAAQWQHWQSRQAMSYGEMAEWQAYFEEIVARFPELREEFEENAII